MMKHIFKLISLTVIISSFSYCSSAQKLQKEAPTTFGQVYFEKWVSGVAQGPTGLNIFIEIQDTKFHPDSIYFRGKVTKLKKISQTKDMYVGRFISKSKHQQDLIMSSDPKAEYGNKVPEKPVKIPFELAHNECVISYADNGKTKYYKLTNMVEKRSIGIPMAPAPNNN